MTMARLFERPWLSLLMAIAVLVTPRITASQDSAAERLIFGSDPEHLWNRLHEALFVRTGPDGRLYGTDRLEPLIWLETKFLFQGESHERLVKLLDEFVR